MKLPRVGHFSLLVVAAATLGCGTYHLQNGNADMTGAGGHGGSGGGGGSGGSGGSGGLDGGASSDGGDGGALDGGPLPAGLTIVGDGGTIPARSCATTFKLNAAGTSITAVAVGGEFNNFTPAMTPMSGPDSAGLFTASVMLAPGSYAYKIVTTTGGTQTWDFDHSTPYTKYVNGTENSVVEVDDCNTPQLTFKTLTKSADGTLHAEAQYIDGNGAAGIDTAKSGVILDGKAFAATIDGNGVISIDATKLAKTKHRLIVNAVDKMSHTATALHVPFWIEDKPFDFRDGLMYFTFTDRFRDGDPTNNALIPNVDFIANFQGGDFAGIKQAIDEGYFDSLGVRTIWVSPPNANPTHGESGTGNHQYSGYHAYWPTAPRTPDPHFGDVSALQTLVATAHAHGMRVIVDTVLNHVHTDHPYWQMHQNDGWFNPLTINSQQCLCGTGPADGCGDWNSTKDNGNHGLLPRQTCWFEPYMPDLDYENWDALTNMIDDALYWARDVDVDGFRVDAVKHFLPLAVTRLRSKLRDQFEHTEPLYYLVGETFDGDRTLIDSFIGPNELSGQFDFPLYFAITDSLATYSGSLKELESATAASDTAFGTALMSPFIGNHDVARFLSTAAGQLTSDPQGQAWTTPPPAPMMDPQTNAYYKQRLALTFVTTSPGVPLIYYGDEYGQPGAGDPDNRRFMKWASYSQFESDTLDLTRKLGAARAELDALRYGIRRTLWIDDNLYVYARVYNEDIALIVINRDLANANTTAVPVPVDLALPDGTMLNDRLGGAPIVVSGGKIPLDIAPHTSAVLAP